MLYYADWVAGLLSLVGMHLVGKKLWCGWLVSLFNLAVLLYINIYFRLWGFIPVSIILGIIYIQNMIKWYKEKNS